MYRLQVLTPEQVFFDDEIISLIAPGEDGYFGVLAHHAPMISALKPGIFIITDKHQKKTYYEIEEGFFEVHDNEAVVLIDQIRPTAPVDMVGGM